jgi:hypothetical protein
MAKKDPCLDIAINEKFGISEEDAKELVDRLKQQMALLKGDPEYLVKLKRAAGAMSEKMKQDLLFAKRRRKAQIIINSQLDNRIVNDPKSAKKLKEYIAGYQPQRWQKDFEKGGTGFQQLDSIAGQQASKRRERLNYIIHSLGIDGAWALSRPTILGGSNLNKKIQYPFGQGIFDDVNFHRDVVHEMFDAPKKGVPVTNNELAQKFAKATIEVKRDVVAQFRANGVNIGWLADHVTTQYHDSVAIASGGFEAGGILRKGITREQAKDRWIQRLYNAPDDNPNQNSGLLDVERTFVKPTGEIVETKAERVKFLSAVFDNIVSGNRHVHELIPTDLNIGRMSLASKVSQSRQLHFKDADSWLAYNNEYGHRNPIDAILTGIERLSDDLELINRMGPNPDLTFKRLMSNVEMTPSEKNKVQGDFDVVSGKAYEIANPSLHQWTANITALQSMSKLGSAVFSAFSDPIYTAFTRSYHGVNIFSAYYDTYKAALQALSSKEIKEFGILMGFGLEGAVGSSAGRFAAARSATQYVTGANNNFFRWNALNGFTNIMRNGAAYIMSRDMYTASKRPWNQLNERYRYALSQYGITEADWGDIRKLPTTKVEGHDLITPYGVRDAIKNGKVPPDLVKRSHQLADKIQMFIVGENTMAVIEPGASEQSFMRRIPFGGEGAGKSGTASAMAARTFWQFRGFPLSMMMRNFPRVAQMGAPAFLHLLPMVGIGYAIKSAKDILKGREPLDPRDPDNIYKIAYVGVTQSGFGGLASDWLLNDVRKYGYGLADLLGGPTIGTAQDVFAVAGATAAVLRGDETVGEIGKTAWKALYNNTPYVNFWASRTILDYAINYQIQEMLHPGALMRMQNRFTRENNQNFLPGLSPAEVVPYGGSL